MLRKFCQDFLNTSAVWPMLSHAAFFAVGMLVYAAYAAPTTPQVQPVQYSEERADAAEFAAYIDRIKQSVVTAASGDVKWHNAQAKSLTDIAETLEHDATTQHKLQQLARHSEDAAVIEAMWCDALQKNLTSLTGKLASTK